MAAPQPEEIYERTKEEGRRRLSRPVLELGATAVVGGFDVAVGLAVFYLTTATLEPKLGLNAAHFVGAMGFGIGFVFIVVGRSELFTENFLVPITGLTRDRASWLKLGELWVVSLVLNLVGGTHSFVNGLTITNSAFLTGVGIIRADTTNSGTISVSSGATLQFAANYTLSGASTLSGSMRR